MTFPSTNLGSFFIILPPSHLTNEPVILQKLRPGKTQFQEGGHRNCRIAQRAEMAVTLCLTVKAFAVHVKYASSSGTRRRQTTRPLSRDLKLDPWLATVMELWPLHGSPPLALPHLYHGAAAVWQCDTVYNLLSPAPPWGCSVTPCIASSPVSHIAN